jgi:hypothetical protein
VISQVVGFFQIVVGSCCDLIEEEKLGATASQDETDSIHDFLLCLELVFVEEVLGKSKSSFRTRDDGDLQKRISSL